MNSSSDTATIDAQDQLTTVFLGKYRELLEGMPEGEPTWVTSGGPEGGLHGTLADITAEEASRDLGGTSIAAHTEHVRWAIDMVNQYFEGNQPTSDWSESWLVKRVDEAAWDELRQALRRAGERLLASVPFHHSWREEFSVNGALASYGHTAYHLGALRQLKKAVRGGLA